MRHKLSATLLLVCLLLLGLSGASAKARRSDPTAGSAMPTPTARPEATPGISAQTSCPPANCTAGRDVGRDYFVQVVGRLNNVPMSDFAVDALVAWEPYENTSACWNPLATTWEMDVVCHFNCLRRDAAGNCIMGVQHYQNQYLGFRATANTLNQGY